MMHPYIKDRDQRILVTAFHTINRELTGLPGGSDEITFEEFTQLKDKLSRRKLLANRKNAKKSTGPKTEAGKKRSSKNAIQHGLTAQSDITSIMLEYDGEFNAFQDKMFWQFAPKSEAETLLVDRIVTLAWRLKRIPLMETQMIDWHCKEDAPHAALMWGEARAFTNLSRYEGQLDRCLHRTFKKLEELQANRNVDHFATRTKATVEVEMARERALDQETRRSVARLRKVESKRAPSSCALHPNENHADLRAQENGVGPQVARHASPTLSPPRERVGAGNSETVPSPKRQRRGEGAKEEAKSQPQNEKSETNPPNLNQVQASEGDRGSESDAPQSSIVNRKSSMPARATVHAPRQASNKPQATSHVSDGAGDGGPLNQAPQSSMLPPMLIQFLDDPDSPAEDELPPQMTSSRKRKAG